MCATTHENSREACRVRIDNNARFLHQCDFTAMLKTLRCSHVVETIKKIVISFESRKVDEG